MVLWILFDWHYAQLLNWQCLAAYQTRENPPVLMMDCGWLPKFQRSAVVSQKLKKKYWHAVDIKIKREGDVLSQMIYGKNWGQHRLPKILLLIGWEEPSRGFFWSKTSNSEVGFTTPRYPGLGKVASYAHQKPSASCQPVSSAECKLRVRAHILSCPEPSICYTDREWWQPPFKYAGYWCCSYHFFFSLSQLHV